MGFRLSKDPFSNRAVSAFNIVIWLRKGSL
jgi:hypothetical protein